MYNLIHTNLSATILIILYATTLSIETYCYVSHSRHSYK